MGERYTTGKGVIGKIKNDTMRKYGSEGERIDIERRQVNVRQMDVGVEGN